MPVFDCLASGQPEVGSGSAFHGRWYLNAACHQVERAGCEVLARLLGALDPVLVLER